jgi:hypothetical protein
MHHRFTLLALLALPAPGSLVGQAHPTPRMLVATEVSVRPRGRLIEIAIAGNRYQLPLDTAMHAHGIDSAEVLSATALGGEYFLLLDAQGPSRGPESATGYCGAGREAYLLWFRLGPALVPLEAAVEPYESCLENAGEGGWGPAAGLQVTVSPLSGGQ